MKISEESQKNQGLLKRVEQILEADTPFFEDKKELIMGVFMILLNHPLGRKHFFLLLSKSLTTEVEGTLLDKIAAVINNTYLMRGNEYTLNDDTALEIIRDYMLENDEFIFYENENRLLRKPKQPVPQIREKQVRKRRKRKKDKKDSL